MSLFDQLTPRQRECLRAVANHRTYKEVARDLGISDSAVEKHLRSAREKLGVETTAEAARRFLAEDGEADPHGGFDHLADQSPLEDERAVSDSFDLQTQGGSGRATTPGAADLDRPLSPLQTLSIIARVVLGTSAVLTLLIASAEGLKAVLT